MKIQTIAVTVTSALALAAPVAAFARSLPVHAPDHHKAITQPKAGSTTKAPKHVIYTAPFGPTPIVTPRYIYIPAMAPSGAVPEAPAANDCTTNGIDCTP